MNRDIPTLRSQNDDAPSDIIVPVMLSSQGMASIEVVVCGSASTYSRVEVGVNVSKNRRVPTVADQKQRVRD